ncbi:MAG: aldehyde ferredoxin oxidoreductase family protein [Chloroflexi bacterium]|nr:aldehyde ferredoxin oxidoreductase family protein [Chloroflexota bacterium]
MHGWAGTILRVDLTTGETKKLPLEESFARKWLGGEGFGAKYLWDEVGPEVEDGLDPRNLLMYTTGPLTGTLAPSSGRLEIVTKSPITNIFGDTNAGGHFAPELKNAGYDLLIISGKADKPVYLWIDDDSVEIRDARQLWGKTVPETDEAIKKEVGDKWIQVSCIGPAGENLVRFAILMNNLSRAPGWTGCGAVAGSKNLKAVAVRGTKGVRIARPAEFEAACWRARERVTALQSLPVMRKMGTMMLIRNMHLGGYLHKHNYGVTQVTAEEMERVSGDRFAQEYVQKSLGCYGCAMHCSHFCVIKEGPYAGTQGEGYEYGSLDGYILWGGSLNLAYGIHATKFCNDYGLDSTEPGELIAWATDCFQRGIINAEDTGGLVLNWGDQKMGMELMRRIVYREGFGDVLAEGLWRASRKIGKGSEYYAPTIKRKQSQEKPTRASYACALLSATSTRGADHLKGFPSFERRHLSPEMGRKVWDNPHVVNPRSSEGKIPMAVYYRLMCTLGDLLGVCKFVGRWFNPLDGLMEKDWAEMTSLATGVDFSPEELLTICRRVYTLEQAYNHRLGLSRKDDTIPKMFFQEAFNTGPLQGHVLKEKEFQKMLDEYYDYWGWDRNGTPTRKALEALDLPDVIASVAKQSPG